MYNYTVIEFIVLTKWIFYVYINVKHTCIWEKQVSRYVVRHILVDILTDIRPICLPKVDWYIGQVSVDMLTDILVEGCKKYSCSQEKPTKYIYQLGYLKDSNATEHSVVSDIFYTQWLIYSSALQDLCINIYFSK